MASRSDFIQSCTGFEWPNGQNMLASREAAMLLCGSWIPVELKDQVDDDWEWKAFPVPEISGGMGKINGLEFYLIRWVALKDTKVAPEAIEFLKFCSTIENMEKYAVTTLSLSAIKNVNTVPELADVQKAIMNVELPFQTTDGMLATYPDYTQNILYKNPNLAFIGEITPDEFIVQMKEDSIEYWKNK